MYVYIFVPPRQTVDTCSVIHGSPTFVIYGQIDTNITQTPLHVTYVDDLCNKGKLTRDACIVHQVRFKYKDNLLRYRRRRLEMV